MVRLNLLPVALAVSTIPIEVTGLTFRLVHDGHRLVVLLLFATRHDVVLHYLVHHVGYAPLQQNCSFHAPQDRPLDSLRRLVVFLPKTFRASLQNQQPRFQNRVEF